MSDKRRKDHADPNKVRIAIIKILKQKPLQAKPLREALKKKGKQYEFSRDRLNDLLNQLMNKGEITKIILDNKPYPVYAVTEKSKILANIQGDFFQTVFETHMIKNKEILLKEFQTAKHKRNSIDSLMQFFGFYVLGTLLASYGLDKKDMTDKELSAEQFEELRQEWLKPALNLQRGSFIPDYFDKLTGNNTDVIANIAFVLSKTYKQNYTVLDRCVKNSEVNNPKIKAFEFDKDAVNFVK